MHPRRFVAGPVAGARYDPATDTWAPMTQVGEPSNRVDFPAVWTGAGMLVGGGLGGATLPVAGGFYR